jgi:hypothetical protein
VDKDNSVSMDNMQIIIVKSICPLDRILGRYKNNEISREKKKKTSTHTIVAGAAEARKRDRVRQQALC